MSPFETKFDHGAGELRTKYAYLFSTIAEIYRYYHQDSKPNTRFEDVKALAQKLFEEGCLSEYLYESLQQVFNLYPTLLPGVVQQGYEKDRKKEVEHLNRLNDLLSITQSDLSQELHDVIIEDNKRFKRRIGL